MKDLKTEAILIRVIRKLREKDSWCGETHIQKSIYILKDFFKLPLEFDFILYKHGPFSFDLRDKLSEMRAFGLLKLEPQKPPYSPRYKQTEFSEKILRQNNDAVEIYDRHINDLSEIVKRKGVAELERFATALFITAHSEECGIDQRAKELTLKKPHIKLEEAKAAMVEADRLLNDIKGHFKDVSLTG